MTTRTVITRCHVHNQANAADHSPLPDQHPGIPAGNRVEFDDKTAARLVALGLATYADNTVIDATGTDPSGPGPGSVA
jgi:hypothetical protein